MKDMDIVSKELESSLYEELYHLSDKVVVVRDKNNNKTCLKKTLTYYNILVFTYLKHHHNIHLPTIYNFWKEKDQLIVIEEFIQGNNLEDLLNENKLSDQEKMNIINGVASALSFLHNCPTPIIHRDVKASNIIINEDGLVKLVDFDASKIYKPDADKDTVLLGTHGSAAPEQYGFGQSDERTDIYALGVLIKRMFPDSKRMLRIAEKATSMEPGKRYQSIEDLEKSLTPHQRNKKKKEKKFYEYINPWHIIYVFIFITAMRTDFDSYTGILLWINRLCFFMSVFSFLEALVNAIGIFNNMPFYNDENKIKKGLCRILLAIFGMILFAAVASLFG